MKGSGLGSALGACACRARRSPSPCVRANARAATAADLSHRSELRPRRRLSDDQGRRAGHRSDAGRLRGPRRRRAAENRAVRARRHSRGGPQDTRIEPNTVRESLRDGAELARARLFVLFLDIDHVEDRRLAPDPPAARRRARSAHRPGRSRRRDDAGHVGPPTSPSRARRRRSRAF